jgi:hypothetical protein
MTEQKITHNGEEYIIPQNVIDDLLFTTNIDLWWETVKSYIEELGGSDTDEILKCAIQLQDYIDSFAMNPIFIYEGTVIPVKSRKTFGDDFNEVIDFMKELKQNNKKIFLYMLYKVKDELGSFHYILRYADFDELKND